MGGNRLVDALRHPAGRGIGIGLVCAVVAWLLGHIELAHGLDNWMVDASFSLRGVRSTQADIVIIGVDEESVEKLKKPVALASPELAEVVLYLKEQGVRAIGLDVYVPDDFSELPAIRDSGESGYALPLGEAVLSAGNVVLPEWLGREGWELPLDQWRIKEQIAPAPTDIGFLNLSADDDKFVRKARLLRDDGKVPQFALAIYARSRGTDFTWDGSVLSVDGAIIPLDSQQRLRINFVGPAGTIPEMSFWKVLAAARAQRSMPELHGAIVLIGVTDWTDEDLVAVPFSNNTAQLFSGQSGGLMGATEVHANIISTLIDRAFILRPPVLNSFGFLLLMGAMLGAVYARISLGWGALLAVAHHIGWRILAPLCFAWAHWRVDVVPMSLLGILVFSATYGMRWRKVRHTLGMLRSERVAAALEQDVRKLDLGGEERMVTVLVADIRGFTTFSQVHAANEVMKLLNAYYGEIVPLIESEGGTVISFQGDGIMVLFGAPVSSADHALRGVRAALSVIRRVHALRDSWSEIGSQDFHIGIAVHSGKAVVGTIGSSQHREFTAIGDTVNTAFRIEAINKEHGSEILISAATHGLLPAEECQRLGCSPEPIRTTLRGLSGEMLLYPVHAREDAAH
ncbi:MAG: CHASE2 domain-containing protein [Gemmataceae bacterium]